MKKFVAALAVLSMTASAALAGGPVVIEEEGQPEVLQERSSSVGWLPLVIGLVVVGAIIAGNDDDSNGGNNGGNGGETGGGEGGGA